MGYAVAARLNHVCQTVLSKNHLPKKHIIPSSKEEGKTAWISSKKITSSFGSIFYFCLFCTLVILVWENVEKNYYFWETMRDDPQLNKFLLRTVSIL